MSEDQGSRSNRKSKGVSNCEYDRRMEEEFRRDFPKVPVGEKGTVLLSVSEAALWDQIEKRSRSSYDSPWFNGGGSGRGNPSADGPNAEERSASEASTAPQALERIAAGGRVARGRSLEPERNSVEGRSTGQYELRACRCRSRFCLHCSLPEGLVTKQKVTKVVRTFKAVLMWTFTIDPKLFGTPADGYRHVQTERSIGEWVRSMWKAGYLHSRRYFCVLEWQKKTEMPHYHVLLDASFIPIEVGQKRWDLFRPESARPVEPGRPGFGWAFVTKVKFANPEHAANYACKYLLKHPEHGFPDWVLDSHGEVKRYSTSKRFYEIGEDKAQAVSTHEETAESADDGDEQTKQDTKQVMSTIRERLARCGHGTVLLELVDIASRDNDPCMKRRYVESYRELDLGSACSLLGMECPQKRHVLLSRMQVSRLRLALGSSGLPAKSSESVAVGVAA